MKIKSERKSDWPTQLTNYIESKKEVKFRWGKHDCAMFAFGAIDAMTETRFIEHLSKRWHSKKSADAFIKKVKGVEHLLARIAKVYKWKRQAANVAQRGDMMVYRINGEITLAVCVGASSVAPGKKKGVTLIPAVQAIYSYKVC